MQKQYSANLHRNQKTCCTFNDPGWRYLWIVHVPEERVTRRVQDIVAPVKLAAVLIFLYVQESTDAVVSVQVRHVPELAEAHKASCKRLRARICVRALMRKHFYVTPVQRASCHRRATNYCNARPRLAYCFYKLYK